MLCVLETVSAVAPLVSLTSTLASTLASTVDGAWVHNIDPVAFTVPGLGLPVRWYGLSYMLGFFAAWLGLKQLAKRELIAISAEQVTDLVIALIVGVIVGGRLGYVLFYQPSLLVEFSPGVPFWGVLAINNGGMASHGGMLGVGAAAWLFCRRAKVPMLHVADAVCLVAPFGLMFGRLANFINGELLGKIVAAPGELAPWWAIRYPAELQERQDELLSVMNDEQKYQLGNLVDVYARPLGYNFEQGVNYLLYQAQLGNKEVLNALGALLSARHPSQLYQAFAEGVVVLAVLWVMAMKPCRKGLLFAWFLIVYGAGRITTEFWRLPDAHFGDAARLLGLSRGQWLSAVMVLAGAGLLVWVMRAKREPMAGGWGVNKASKSTAPKAAEKTV